MSDSKSSYGDPVEEPRPVDDVVGSAHEGIADAEAAGRNAVVSDEPVVHESPVVEKTPVTEPPGATPQTPGSLSHAEPLVEEDPSFDSAMYSGSQSIDGFAPGDTMRPNPVVPS